MREPEGIEMPPPGKSSERPWSKHREPDIRNVEAVGSNPITSTIHLVGSPQSPGFAGLSRPRAELSTGFMDVFRDG